MVTISECRYRWLRVLDLNLLQFTLNGWLPAALSLFHNVDATVMILMWNVGTAVAFVGFGGLFGRRMFQWAAPRADLGN